MADGTQTPSIGVVAEGPSDHTVLQLILAGYFHDPDIDPKPLQPLRDATGTFEEKGGWHQVLEYCASEKFRAAFRDNDYIVVQIDTDASEQHPAYGVPHRDKDGRILTCEELIICVTDKLVETIGPEFYAAHGNRILFAICVHSLECWLLPLYWDDKRRERTNNCLPCLNEQIDARFGFRIDAKDARYYYKIAKPYAKERTLRQHWQANPSLQVFVEALESRFGRGFVEKGA